MEVEKLKNISFFQSVYLLERYHKNIAQVGYNGPAAQEVIRFHPNLSMTFPTSDLNPISHLKLDNKDMYELVINFMGLYGISSPMPTFYTEELILRNDESNLVKGFLDIFNHRLISLFYRAWSKYHYHVLFTEDGEDEVSRRIFSFIGLGTEKLRRDSSLKHAKLIRYTGLFLQRPRSALGLKKILCNYFNEKNIEIKECIGQWADINEEYRNRLGEQNCRIGDNFLIGDKLFEKIGKFRISIGPMDFESFKLFMPLKEKYIELVKIVKLYLTDFLDFDIELIINSSKIGQAKLSNKNPVKLGHVCLSKPYINEKIKLVV